MIGIIPTHNVLLIPTDTFFSDTVPSHLTKRTFLLSLCCWFLAFTETAVVPIVLIILGVPLIVVAGGQVEVGILSRASNKVIKLKDSSGVPHVLAISSPISSSPVVSSVPIAGGVLVVHVEPQALHRVRVKDVGEGERLSELR